MHPATYLLAEAALLGGTQSRMPTAVQIGYAVSNDRFRDDCAGENGDGCPPINIYRVVVKNSKCRPMPVPVALARYRSKPIAAVDCQFKSAVTGIVRTKSGRLVWKADHEKIYLLAPEPHCLDARAKESPICGPLWVVTKN